MSLLQINLLSYFHWIWIISLMDSWVWTKVRNLTTTSRKSCSLESWFNMKILNRLHLLHVSIKLKACCYHSKYTNVNSCIVVWYLDHTINDKLICWFTIMVLIYLHFRALILFYLRSSMSCMEDSLSSSKQKRLS